MRIVFIGFSNVGKSYWSKKLEDELGYTRVCCDDLIEQGLVGALPQDAQGVGAVAQWLGHPHQVGYTKREALYLQQEEQVLESFLNSDFHLLDENFVFDTTGSVVYCSKEMQDRLHEIGIIVYVRADTVMRQELLSRFFVEPKPLIWGNIFSQEVLNQGKNEGEILERLKEAFPELIRFREEKYEELADVIVNASDIRRMCMSAEELLLKIREAQS